MPDLGPLEKETCRDYVVPKLHAAGWSDEQIVEQYPVTHGRIVPVGRKHRREKPLRADYLLEVQPGFQVGVVEAKREYKEPGDGMQQAMRYAERLDIPLAYSCNGKGIVEHDFDSGLESKPSGFPTPEQALARFRAWKGLTEGSLSTLVRPFNRELRVGELSHGSLRNVLCR